MAHVGLRAGMDAVGKGKLIIHPLRKSDKGSTRHQPLYRKARSLFHIK